MGLENVARRLVEGIRKNPASGGQKNVAAEQQC